MIIFKAFEAFETDRLEGFLVVIVVYQQGNE